MGYMYIKLKKKGMPTQKIPVFTFKKKRRIPIISNVAGITSTAFLGVGWVGTSTKKQNFELVNDNVIFEVRDLIEQGYIVSRQDDSPEIWKMIKEDVLALMDSDVEVGYRKEKKEKDILIETTKKSEKVEKKVQKIQNKNEIKKLPIINTGEMTTMQKIDKVIYDILLNLSKQNIFIINQEGTELISKSIFKQAASQIKSELKQKQLWKILLRHDISLGSKMVDVARQLWLDIELSSELKSNKSKKKK